MKPGKPDERPADNIQNEKVIYTIGHSSHPIEKFIGLLKQHGITAVADVRSAPYSRFHPQFSKQALAASLEEVKITYVFLGKELGARPDAPDCYENGQVNFECLANRAEFKQGLERVLKSYKKYRVALMCAEKEPLDCHRTVLVCRNLKHQGISIKHILSDGLLEDNLVAEARLIKITDCEKDLFDQDMSDSERLALAYKKRAREIAYNPEHEEARHD